ncbi:hypothetical protein [Gulosibacter molinativorax]|uniref:Uncharacterized protein n=1 Tax=Gulosibacter molinativorax TaxID=256821 RepID=A0ABT7CB81_9MICO|nr:hypothetical protein [Gulosibacter molinativorax]MDJ1372415.1 hypothetical protein [Gulosibacter molinativorax]QUY61133.1 Exopolyphosphatase [Gulosibacter molinativorax]
MPTFQNPTADAADASEALRGLAHATRVFEDPADTYAVLGDLLAGVRSLRQVFDQVATVHVTHRVRAYDDAGDQAAGATNALTATAELQQAAALVDAVHDRVDAAMAASGRIAWHPEPTDPPSVSRWVSVVFLQGQDADEVLAIIDRDGANTAIEHLAGFDMGDETTQAALVNGYVYDAIPAGLLDRTTRSGEYMLTYNHDHGHVSLLRTHPEPPEPAAEAPAAKRTPARPKARRQTEMVEDEDDPFAPSRSSSLSRGRAL